MKTSLDTAGAGLFLLLSVELACTSTQSQGADASGESSASATTTGATMESDSTEDETGATLDGGETASASASETGETTGGSEGSACDIWSQDDCGQGEKCTAAITGGSSAWNQNLCVPILGDGVPGDECMHFEAPGHDDCGPGAMCWGSAAGQVGSCVAFCTGSPEAPRCADRASCSVLNNGVLPVCIELCDPLAPACREGDVCVALDDTGFKCVNGIAEGMGVYGFECPFANACNPGLLCAPAYLVATSECDQGAQRCCTPICDLSVPDECPEQDLGMSCRPFWPPTGGPPGYQNVGWCTLTP